MFLANFWRDFSVLARSLKYKEPVHLHTHTRIDDEHAINAMLHALLSHLPSYSQANQCVMFVSFLDNCFHGNMSLEQSTRILLVYHPLAWFELALIKTRKLSILLRFSKRVNNLIELVPCNLAWKILSKCSVYTGCCCSNNSDPHTQSTTYAMTPPSLWCLAALQVAAASTKTSAWNSKNKRQGRVIIT